MNSRQRVETALDHQWPDVVPLDLGASGTTGMHVSSVYQLRQGLGLDPPGVPVKVVEPYQMLGEIAPDLLDRLGIDVVGLGNPVQCSAADMEPRVLKERFGDRLTFWGGGIDTQKTLPFGTPEQIRAEATERIDVFGRGGGFVFNTVHNVQANTPRENLLALYQAVADTRGQPS